MDQFQIVGVTNLKLELINLSSNKLSGVIPCSIAQIPGLAYLHLNNNTLTGPFSSCLGGLKYLKIMDLGENKLCGEIPTWINGNMFTTLLILRLRDNEFSGIIPLQLCSLSNLLVMDLANNHYTGNIPHCVNNLTAMASPKNVSFVFQRSDLDSYNSVQEVIQGIEHSYTTTVIFGEYRPIW